MHKKHLSENSIFSLLLKNFLALASCFLILDLPILWVKKRDWKKKTKKNKPSFSCIEYCSWPRTQQKRAASSFWHTHKRCRFTSTCCIATAQMPSPSPPRLASDANISGAAGENMEGASEAWRRSVFTEVFSSLFCRFILFTLRGSGRRVNFSSLVRSLRRTEKNLISESQKTS